MTDRIKPARQLADARERITAQLDAAWQRIANLDDELRKLTARADAARAEHATLQTVLAAFGVVPTRGRKPSAAQTTPAKPARRPRAAVPAPEGVAAAPGNGKGDAAE
jgi:hypothetical protein